MRGGYLSVQNGQPTGFNPFQIESTEDNIQFLISFRKLLPPDGQAANHDIGDARSSPRPEGSNENAKGAQAPWHCSADASGGPDEGREGELLAKRLTRWIAGGDLAWVFDNPVDELNFDAYPNMGVDGTEFLDNTEVRTPIAYYLLHRMNEVIDGRRFIFIMDEFWKWLLDDAFRDLPSTSSRPSESRTDSASSRPSRPRIVIESPIAKAVIEQSATQIFLPNPRADKRMITSRDSRQPRWNSKSSGRSRLSPAHSS